MSSRPRMGGGFGNKNALGQHGKRSRQEFLPDRHALAKLTGGSPADRTLSMYAKATPSGANALTTYDDIIAMGQDGPKIDE
jgi:hypothetical protein